MHIRAYANKCVYTSIYIHVFYAPLQFVDSLRVPRLEQLKYCLLKQQKDPYYDEFREIPYANRTVRLVQNTCRKTTYQWVRKVAVWKGSKLAAKATPLSNKGGHPDMAGTGAEMCGLF